MSFHPEEINSNVISAYNKYVLDNCLIDISSEYTTLFEEVSNNKILPAINLKPSENNSAKNFDIALMISEMDWFEKEYSARMELIDALINNDTVKYSMLLLKGISIERLYHEKSKRFAYDVDICVRDFDALKILDLIIKEHGYDIHLPSIWQTEKNIGTSYCSLRYTRSENDNRGFEVHVGHYPLRNRSQYMYWDELFSGSYTTIYKSLAIRVPNDLCSVYLSLYKIEQSKVISIRDFIDFVLLFDQIEKEVYLKDFTNYVIKNELTYTLYRLVKYGKKVLNHISDQSISITTDFIEIALTESGLLKDKKTSIKGDPDPVFRLQYERGDPMTFVKKISDTEKTSYSIDTEIGRFYGIKK